MPATTEPQGTTTLTVPEAAHELRVNRSTIYRWINEGHLVSVQIGGARRIARAEVERIASGSAA